MMPGVGFMVGVVGLGSENPEFKSHSVVELIPGGVDSACYPSVVGIISSSMLVYCIGVATRPGLCPIVKEAALAAPTLCTEYGPNGLMDGWMDGWSILIQPRYSMFFLVNHIKFQSVPCLTSPCKLSIHHWDRTLCRALVLPKQSPWLLDTILDGSPLQYSRPARCNFADLRRITGRVNPTSY